MIGGLELGSVLAHCKATMTPRASVPLLPPPRRVALHRDRLPPRGNCVSLASALAWLLLPLCFETGIA